jgi:ABC transport system ATP-binding/permease protein
MQLTATSLAIEIQGRTLFKDITLSITEGERIALIGRNGSGKSTLLKILAKNQEPDSGDVVYSKDLVPGYISQHDTFQSSTTTIQDLLKAESLQKNVELSYMPQKILSQCGFSDFSLPVNTLSGGWKKRLSFAIALASNPNFLLIDEPTNHLDLSGIMWLQELLLGFKGGMLFISHDRALIEAAATKVIELNPHYPEGYFVSDEGYVKFLERKAEKLSALKKSTQSLANKVRRETEWLRQGAKARTTKSESRIKNAEILQKELGQAKERTLHLGDKAELNFSTSVTNKKEVLTIESIKVLAPPHSALLSLEKTLIHDYSLCLKSGDILGVLGANGSGKSSLLKVLSLSIPPAAGRIKPFRPDIRIRYFEQHRESLDPKKTLKETFAPDTDYVVYQNKEFHIIPWIQKFLFRSEQLYTPVGSLSGGEQARVMLAKFIIEPADLLIFDEPTNDLDIDTIDLLQDSFQEFQGAILLVSHDRVLLDSVCTKMIGLDGKGNVYSVASSYQWVLLSETFSEEHKTEQSPQSNQNKLTSQEKQELRTIEKNIQKSEKKLHQLGETLNMLVSTATTQSEHDKIKMVGVEIKALQESLEKMYRRWELLEEKR